MFEKRLVKGVKSVMAEPFSVSMCVYGKDDPEWFRIAVDSILAQSVKPDEVVLVVDGPVPAELDQRIAACEAMSCFKVIRLEKNMGHGAARRIGLENCTHGLVALMDADDISVPDRFEKQLAVFAEDSRLSVLGGQISEFISDTSNIVGYRVVPETYEEIREYLQVRCPVNQVTAMFRKGDVMKAGGYLDWYCNEDYYLWVRMHLKGMKFRNTPEVLVNVRVNENMYQRRGGWKYFLSEAKLQTFMLKKRAIGPGTYLMNVLKRFVVQVILPNRLRGWVFQKFARENHEGNGKI